MNDTETKNEQLNENPNQMFFDKGTPKKSNKQEKDLQESRSNEFTGKTTNRKLDEPYNIHFTIGSGIFSNLILFLSDIDYNVALLFRKKEVQMIAIDPGDSHGSVVRFDKIELSDYTHNLEKDDDEKWIMIDTSVITDDMSINEEKPIDFYVDTLQKNRFYVINGKERVGRQLNSVNTSDGIDALLKRHKNFEHTIQRLTTDEKYQKVVVNYAPLLNAIKSLSKKTDKQKDASTLCTLYVTKYDLDWRIENEVKSSSIMLSSDDVVVYPLKDDIFRFNLKFFNKFGKIKLTSSAEMYISGQMPIILSSRLGGGGLRIWFLLAPRIDGD